MTTPATSTSRCLLPWAGKPLVATRRGRAGMAWALRQTSAERKEVMPSETRR